MNQFKAWTSGMGPPTLSLNTKCYQPTARLFEGEHCHDNIRTIHAISLVYYYFFSQMLHHQKLHVASSLEEYEEYYQHINKHANSYHNKASCCGLFFISQQFQFFVQYSVIYKGIWWSYKIQYQVSDNTDWIRIHFYMMSPKNVCVAGYQLKCKF